MGLDMYLTVERYLWADVDKAVSDAVSKALGVPLTARSIALEGVYWRKANAIHQWFVEHVQGGKDECQRAWVEKRQLEDLVALCKKVLKSPKKLGPKLLPTAVGFYFGNTEYDKWYVDVLKRTVKGIERLLALRLSDDYSFYYRASW